MHIPLSHLIVGAILEYHSTVNSVKYVSSSTSLAWILCERLALLVPGADLPLAELVHADLGGGAFLVVAAPKYSRKKHYCT